MSSLQASFALTSLHFAKHAFCTVRAATHFSKLCKSNCRAGLTWAHQSFCRATARAAAGLPALLESQRCLTVTVPLTSSACSRACLPPSTPAETADSTAEAGSWYTVGRILVRGGQWLCAGWCAVPSSASTCLKAATKWLGSRTTNTAKEEAFFQF